MAGKQEVARLGTQPQTVYMSHPLEATAKRGDERLLVQSCWLRTPRPPNVRHEPQTPACRWLSARWKGWAPLPRRRVRVRPSAYPRICGTRPRFLVFACDGITIPSGTKCGTHVPLPCNLVPLLEVCAGGRKDPKCFRGAARCERFEDDSLHIWHRRCEIGVHVKGGRGIVNDVYLARHGLKGLEDCETGVDGAKNVLIGAFTAVNKAIPCFPEELQ